MASSVSRQDGCKFVIHLRCSARSFSSSNSHRPGSLSSPYFYLFFFLGNSRGRNRVSRSWTSPGVWTTPASEGRQPGRSIPVASRMQARGRVFRAQLLHRHTASRLTHNLTNGESAGVGIRHRRRRGGWCGWSRRRRRDNHIRWQHAKPDLAEIEGGEHVRPVS